MNLIYLGQFNTFSCFLTSIIFSRKLSNKATEDSAGDALEIALEMRANF